MWRFGASPQYSSSPRASRSPSPTTRLARWVTPTHRHDDSSQEAEPLVLLLVFVCQVPAFLSFLKKHSTKPFTVAEDADAEEDEDDEKDEL
jgi:hypothetical protein